MIKVIIYSLILTFLELNKQFMTTITFKNIYDLCDNIESLQNKPTLVMETIDQSMIIYHPLSLEKILFEFFSCKAINGVIYRKLDKYYLTKK